jgi:hypothetical protein
MAISETLALSAVMEPILQDTLPYDPVEKPLPGIAPLDPEQWLIRDDAFRRQMALRDHLVADRPRLVMAMEQGAEPACHELLNAVLDVLRERPGYSVGQGHVTRPDGITVVLDPADPLRMLGRLVQEDFCILEKPDGAEEHVLTAAILCFPAGWTLAEKIGRPLIRIHKPVASYDPNIAKRVQRLFDGVQVGRPLWRFNALDYQDPSLFQPRKEGVQKYGDPVERRFMRSERQTLSRLPDTRAVVFGIHTFVTRKTDAS